MRDCHSAGAVVWTLILIQQRMGLRVGKCKYCNSTGHGVDRLDRNQ
jgi:hypothetical protein